MSDRGGDPSPDFLSLADTVDELVFVWKPTGEMLWVNRTFERETGMSVEDFRFRNEQNPFIHPEDLPRVLVAIEAFLGSSNEVSSAIENRFFDVWGRVRSLRSVLRKCNFRGEDALLLVSAIIDPNRAERDAEQSYRQLIEAADDGILKLAKDGSILYSNRRMQTLAEADPVALSRRSFPDLFTDATRPDVRRALNDVKNDGPASHCRAQLSQSGAWLDVKVTNLTDADHSVAALAIARDVTEMRRLEFLALRREREEALALLVGGIAHDLNNIVTGVLANTTFVERFVRSDPLLAQTVSDIRLAGERAAEMGRGLLTYIGQAPADIREVEIDVLVRETLRMVRPLLGSAVEANTEGISSTARVRGDRGQIGQIVMNLLMNAAQALGERGGTVTVETGTVSLSGSDDTFRPSILAPGTYALVRVADTGPGILPDAIERIFDPFFTTKRTGHGLGLSTSLGVLKRHEGGIRVKSQLGHGTTFEVYLPVCTHEPVPEESGAARPFPRGATILVVDDEPAICLVVKRILETAGATVLTARNGAEALLHAESQKLDAAVMDCRLPGESGPDIAARISALQPELRVLFSSGYQEELGNGRFLQKPFTSQQLLDSIGSLFSSSSGP